MARRRGRARKSGARKPNGRLQQLSMMVRPTPERFRRGPLERLEWALADAAGGPAGVYRAVDLLAALERRGAIGPEERRAGDRFRIEFHAARLLALGTRDLSRPIGGGPAPAPQPAGTAIE
jgi:hypothetical protein